MSSLVENKEKNNSLPKNMKPDDEKVQELLTFRDEIEKSKDDNDILEVLLKKYYDIFDKYSIDDCIVSKIGKTLKELLSISDINNDNKEIVNDFITKIKNKVNLLKSNKTIEDNKENKDRENNKEKKDIKNNKEQHHNKEPKNSMEFKQAYKKQLESLKSLDDPKRNNCRGLLFESLVVEKDTSIEKLCYIKTVTELIENAIFDNLFNHSEKGAYLQRVKSIVFNLGVRKK